jgi:predicted nucleic acid-binding protein
MAVRVVDASAVGALAFGEPGGETIAERLQNADLIAPSLFPFEIASICLKKIRRHPGARAALIESFGIAQCMPIALADVNHAEVLLMAERSGLTTYDASYLWLAEKNRADLVTLDKLLAAAARKMASS